MLRSLRDVLPTWSFSSGFHCGRKDDPVPRITPSAMPPVRPPVEESSTPQLEDSYESLLCSRLNNLSLYPDTDSEPLPEPEVRSAPQRTSFPESRLGSLPFELREIIYKHALGHSRTTSDDDKQSYILKRRTASQEFALLRACRQVYFETRPVFFSGWTFYFENARHLFEFLIIIGRAREHLCEIRLAPTMTLRPIFYQELIASQFDALGILDKYQDKIEGLVYPDLDPMMFNVKVLLRQCNKLKKLHFDVWSGSQYHYHQFLGGDCDLWLRHLKMVVQDPDHWVIMDNPNRMDYDYHEPRMEFYGFNMHKWKRRDKKPLKTICVELKCSPKQAFKGGHYPDLKGILKTEIAQRVAERSQVFPNLEVS